MLKINKVLNRIKNREAGFTLVELLVVIAIIGILVALVLVSLTSARRKARDAQRKSDLRAMQTALELDASDKNDGYLCVNNPDRTDNFRILRQYLQDEGYLQAKVQDPRGDFEGANSYYFYSAKSYDGSAPVVCSASGTSHDAYQYELSANLEVDDMANDGGNEGTRYEVGTELELLP